MCASSRCSTDASGALRSESARFSGAREEWYACDAVLKVPTPSMPNKIALV
jgi:hypothetical protein